MTKQEITIATRESPLALKQAMWVKNRLMTEHPQLTVHLLGMTTVADQQLSISLSAIGGKGLFVKELEEALLDRRADIAVHSMKDVPSVFPDGLCLPVICERENPFDALVSNRFHAISRLPAGALVGSSSFRRQSQLKALRPDLTVISLRGNVNTRLKRLDQGDFQAIILATAGLKRLELENRISVILTPDQMLPSAGQGALGIECREDDKAVQALIQPLNHFETQSCVRAERAVCHRLGGSCRVPVGAYAEIVQDQLYLRGLVGSLDGQQILRANGKGRNPEQLGLEVAEELIRQGAMELMKCV